VDDNPKRGPLEVETVVAAPEAPPRPETPSSCVRLEEALSDPDVAMQLRRLARLSDVPLAAWSPAGELLFTTGPGPQGPPSVTGRTDLVGPGGRTVGWVGPADGRGVDDDRVREALSAARHVVETWVRSEGEKNELASEILVRLRELNVLHDVSGALARAEGAAEVGRDVLTHAAEVVAPSYGMFVAHDNERSVARVAAVTGAWDGVIRGWHPFERDSLIWIAMNAAEALVLPVLSPAERELLVRDLGPLARAAASVMVVPTCVGEEPLGAVVLLNGPERMGFSSVEAKLVSAMASQAAVSLKHLRLYEESQEMFFSTVWSLASAIDAKDAYTHGHGQRVARYAASLAREIGFDDDEVERLELSSVLHDVGKIGVPEAILNKPGRLTAAEMAIMKTHPEKGADILSTIRSMRDIVPGVRHHHERWDGDGYPGRLKGENIPLLARIILVADTFDAMTSTRPYRPGLPVDVALAELRRCAGSQFEQRMADTFIRLVEKGDVVVIDDGSPRRAPQHCAGPR